jgi:hypothetical protein
MGVSDMGDAPKPITSKLSVEIDSMQPLLENLDDDATAFDSQMKSWGAMGRKEYPGNAQIGFTYPDENFVEGAAVRNGNKNSLIDAETMVGSIKRSLIVLRLGVKNIAMLYKGEDGFANCNLKQIQDLFPENPLKPGETDADRLKLPAVEDWVPIGTEGWDVDHDGKVDVKMPGGNGEQPPAGLDDTSSENSPPEEVNGETHAGYNPVFNTEVPAEGENRSDDNTLSNAGKANLASNQTTILAPGPLDGLPGDGGSSTTTTTV